jgi:hypothetical protein
MIIHANASPLPAKSTIRFMLLAIIAEANKHKAAIGDRMHANVTKAREAKISL